MFKRNTLFVGCVVSAVAMVGCSSKPTPSHNDPSSYQQQYQVRQFVAIDPNPVYMVVVLRKGSAIMGTTTVQGDQMNQIVKQITKVGQF